MYPRMSSMQVLNQIPPHLAVEVIKALDGGVGPPLTVLPSSLHHLAVSAHLPSVSSEKTLRLDGHTFVWSPSSAVLEALLHAVSKTPLRNITVCCCCLEMLAVSTGVVDAFTCMLHSSSELTYLALGGAFCTGSIVSAVTDALPALPQLRSLTLQPESLGIKRSQKLFTALATYATQLTELSLHGLRSSADKAASHPAAVRTTASSASAECSCGNVTTCSHNANMHFPPQHTTTALATVLLRLTQLESLNLTGETLTDPSLRAIEAALSDPCGHSSSSSEQRFLPKLTHLNFRCAELRDAGCRALVPVLRCLTSLQELWFLWNPVEGSTAEVLASALGSLPQLTMINLRQSNLGEVGGQALAQSLGQLTGLRHLDISFCHLTCSSTAGLLPVLAHCNHLEHLDISGCPLVGTGGVEGCGGGAQTLADALHEHTALKHLFLRSVGLSSEGAKVLAPCLARQTGLQSLYLQCNNQLGSAGIVELSRSFESLSSLETLRLECTEVDAAAARAFGAALLHLTALKSLNLIGFRLQLPDTLEHVAFGSSFSKLARLEVLDLSGSSFSSLAAQGLTRALQHMCKLQELHLQYNPVGDVGAISLARELTKLQHLREFNLIGADLSEKGATEVVKELDGHPALEMCLLDANDVGEMVEKRRWLSSQTDDLSKQVCLREYWRRAMNPI
jgi:Leucine-rich repeat (LRR) protein